MFNTKTDASQRINTLSHAQRSLASTAAFLSQRVSECSLATPTEGLLMRAVEEDKEDEENRGE